MAVPMRADIGRQDRPGHVCKTPGKEWRAQFDDVMLRFKPGDETCFPLAPADFAEADKGVHLVLVAAHRFYHCRDMGDVGIGRGRQQFMIAAQPPQQPVEDRETLAVAMQDRDLRQFDEPGRYAERAIQRLQRRSRWFEQFGRVTGHAPYHVGWLYAVERKRARGVPPAFEIGLAVELDEVHGLLSLFVLVIPGREASNPE